MLKHLDIEIYNALEALEVEIINWSETEVEYTVKNTPICQWDQHSRARLGVEFLDYKVSEEPKYIVYSSIFNKLKADSDFNKDTFDTLLVLEKVRNSSNFKTQYNLMTRSCSYRVKQSMSSLFGQMSRRLSFSEEEFIVGLHWMLRDKLIKLGLKQAEKFAPSCDKHKSCQYSKADYLSNMFGCLFAGCGRWPQKTEFATFNQSCTDRKDTEYALNIKIPMSEYEASLNEGRQ